MAEPNEAYLRIKERIRALRERRLAGEARTQVVAPTPTVPTPTVPTPTAPADITSSIAALQPEVPGASPRLSASPTPSARPLPSFDWGEQLGRMAIAPLNVIAPSIGMGFSRFLDKKYPETALPEDTGNLRRAVDPLLRGLQAAEERVFEPWESQWVTGQRLPGIEGVSDKGDRIQGRGNPFYNQRANNLYQQLISQGHGRAASMQAAYKQAKEEGEVSGMSEALLAVFSDPLSIAPGIGIPKALPKVASKLPKAVTAAKKAGTVVPEVTRKSIKIGDDVVVTGRDGDITGKVTGKGETEIGGISGPHVTVRHETPSGIKEEFFPEERVRLRDPDVAPVVRAADVEELIPGTGVTSDTVLPYLSKPLKAYSNAQLERMLWTRSKGATPRKVKSVSPGLKFYEAELAKRKRIAATPASEAVTPPVTPTTAATARVADDVVPPASAVKRISIEGIPKLTGRPGTDMQASAAVFASEPERELVFKLTDSLKKTPKPTSAELTALRRAQRIERGKRVGALRTETERQVKKGTPRAEALEKGTGKLFGEYPKAQISTANLGWLTKSDKAALSNIIKVALDRKVIQQLDEVRASKALKALYNEGSLPTKGDLKLFSRIFGDGFANSLVGLRPGVLGRTGYTWKELLLDIFNMPRANISSFDVSYLARQGGMLVLSNVSEAKEAFELSVKAIMFSGKDVLPRLTLAQRQVNNGDTWKLLVEEGGLFLHDPSSAARIAGGREEAFMSSLAGRFFPWVRASERAYGTFLNKFRWDVMERMIREYEHAVGKKIDVNVISDAEREMVKGLGKYINAMTGRGPLPSARDVPGIDSIASLMNALMFSPRLFTSRIMVPKYAGEIVGRGAYRAAVEGDDAARAYYKTLSKTTATQLGTWFGAGIGILGLAKAGGLEVGTDWRSSDFGKIKIGTTRYDIWSGYSQIARAIGQTVSGEIKSSSTGELRKSEPSDVLSRFARSKFSPGAGMAVQYTTKEGFLGEDRDILEDMKTLPIGMKGIDEESFWTNFFVPLFIRDLSDSIEAEVTPIIPDKSLPNREEPSLFKGAAVGALKAIPGVLGFGQVTYRTLDDIAAEMTQDQPGGSITYTELQPYQKAQAKEIRKESEAEKGITRTQGMTAARERNDKAEADAYQRLSEQVGELTVSEVRDVYYKTQAKHRTTERMIFAGLDPDKDDKQDISLQRETMTPVQLRVQSLYDMLDRAEELRGFDIPYGDFEVILNNWETSMLGSGDPVDRAAVFSYRMNRYKSDIPEDLLRVLSKGTRARYQAARELRKLHAEGKVMAELYE